MLHLQVVNLAIGEDAHGYLACFDVDQFAHELFPARPVYIRFAGAVEHDFLSCPAPLNAKRRLIGLRLSAVGDACKRIQHGPYLCYSTLARSRYRQVGRSEEHTSELQSLMRNSYAVFFLKKKKNNNN